FPPWIAPPANTPAFSFCTHASCPDGLATVMTHVDQANREATMRYHRQSRIFQCTGLFAVFINMNMALADDRSEPSTRPVEPSSQWQSAFADYDAFEAQPVLSWPMLNRRVGDIGGWRTYAMEPYVEKPAE